MKITVKISDIEIIIDRPEFYEVKNDLSQKSQNDGTILPLIKQAVESAKELYSNRVEQLNK